MARVKVSPYGDSMEAKQVQVKQAKCCLADQLGKFFHVGQVRAAAQSGMVALPDVGPL